MTIATTWDIHTWILTLHGLYIHVYHQFLGYTYCVYCHYMGYTHNVYFQYMGYTIYIHVDYPLYVHGLPRWPSSMSMLTPYDPLHAHAHPRWHPSIFMVIPYLYFVYYIAILHHYTVILPYYDYQRYTTSTKKCNPVTNWIEKGSYSPLERLALMWSNLHLAYKCRCNQYCFGLHIDKCRLYA